MRQEVKQDPLPPESRDPLGAAGPSTEGTFLYPTPWGGKALFVLEERGRWGSGDERIERAQAQQAKTQEVHQKVESGVASLAESLAQGHSEEFVRFLDAMGRFHRYSFGNAFLIALQRPDATLVAGFTAWKEMGRYVKAGEKGIAILAPLPKRLNVEAKDEEGTEEEKTTTKTISGSGVWGFKVVHVFDVSQTGGKPLPELAAVKGEPAHYLTRLKGEVQAQGILLEYRESLGGAFGVSRSGRIELLQGMPPAKEFSVLVHEFAHELLHPLTERAGISRTVKETEAEAVAYVVGRAIGLEPGTASSDYIQLYRGDTATLAASLDRIQKTATRILSALEEKGAVFSEAA
jgi:hypothetical protein